MNSTASQEVSRNRYASGITVLWSEIADTATFCRALADESAKNETALALIAYSSTRHDSHSIVVTMAELAPGLMFSGCSTSGEVTP
ncbi:MAG: hypothetical protein ACI9JP_003056, partial [Granulosicoccus sp.]